MITDQTLDEAIVEAARFVKVAKALRAALEISKAYRIATGLTWEYAQPVPEESALREAAVNLTRKLVDLRAGR